VGPTPARDHPVKSKRSSTAAAHVRQPHRRYLAERAVAPPPPPAGSSSADAHTTLRGERQRRKLDFVPDDAARSKPLLFLSHSRICAAASFTCTSSRPVRS